MIADLVPEHQGHHAFLPRNNVTLAEGKSILIDIASHVEGVGDGGHPIELQLRVYGEFYMISDYGIVSTEQMLRQLRCRLRVDNINIMQLSKID